MADIRIYWDSPFMCMVSGPCSPNFSFVYSKEWQAMVPVRLEDMMQVPKAIYVENHQQAKDMAEIMNRPVLVELDSKFYRVSPSGKMEDLTEKIATVRKLLAADPRQASFDKPRK